MEIESQHTSLRKPFSIIGALFGFVLLIMIVQIYKTTLVRHWPTTEGVVARASSKGWWDEEAKRRHYLEYQYIVEGTQYTSSQFHISPNYVYPGKRYHTGDPITVWYSPKEPDVGVVTTNLISSGLGISIGFFGFCVLIAMMILKERRWLQHWEAFNKRFPTKYDGRTPLPSSNILQDENNRLTINTGMSVFWNTGIPFAGFSFIAVFVIMMTLDDINPGMSPASYMGVVMASLLFSISGCLLFRHGFARYLYIDSFKKEITEHSVFFFKEKTATYPFRDISELSLCKELWDHRNSLKNWTLYMRTEDNKAVFICYKHRDLQPAHHGYLGMVKKRIEYLTGNTP